MCFTVDLPGKPDWIGSVRRTTIRLMHGDAYDEGAAVLHFLHAYEKSTELAGPALSALMLRLGRFKQALGIAQLPEHIERHGFVYLTF